MPARIQDDFILTPNSVNFSFSLMGDIRRWSREGHVQHFCHAISSLPSIWIEKGGIPSTQEKGDEARKQNGIEERKRDAYSALYIFMDYRD